MSTKTFDNALGFVAADRSERGTGPFARLLAFWEALVDGFAAYRAYAKLTNLGVDPSTAARMAFEGHSAQRD